jgi:hypothetical protein
MPVTNSARGLLPENDPPVWPSTRYAWWAVIVLLFGIAGMTAVGIVWGRLDVWESLSGVVLGLALAVLGLRWMSRKASKAPGTPADDASLREEVRKWRNDPHRR